MFSFLNGASSDVPDNDLKNWIAFAKKILWRPEFRQRLEDNDICLTPSRFYN